MVSGDSPEDFIKRNLERLSHPTPASPAPYSPESRPVEGEAAPVPSALEPQSTPLAPSASAPAASNAPGAPQGDKALETHLAESKPQATQGSQPQSSEPSQPSDGTVPEGSTLVENIRNLRKSLNESKAVLKQKETELKAITEERDKYQKGEVLPDIVKELEAKVQELSKYRDLVDLEASPEYQERFHKPMEALVARLDSVAKDYEIPEEVMNQALTLTNQKELNHFLADHFDELGASDVRGIVRDIQALQKQAGEARAKPKEAYSRLINETQAARTHRMAEQKKAIASKAKASWVNSVRSVQETGVAPTIRYREDDTEHNEKVVRPIVESAATEFGKLISKLADAGLETLPDDLSDALAQMVLLAHASAAEAVRADHAVELYNQIERNAQRTTEYQRPPVGGSFGSNTPPPNRQPQGTVEQESRKLMDSILPKYQNRVLAGR